MVLLVLNLVRKFVILLMFDHESRYAYAIAIAYLISYVLLVMVSFQKKFLLYCVALTICFRGSEL